MKFSKLTKAMLMAAVMTVLSAGQVLALNERGDHTFWGQSDFQGPLKIDGTEVTATAAQLNTAGTVGAYPLVTNVSVAITPSVVTNVTVGGGVLSGVDVVVTNATVGGGALSGVSIVVTNATVAGAALSGVETVVTNVAGATTIAAVTNGTISSFDNPTNISKTVVIACTNGTIAVTLTPQSFDLVYLDAGSNVVTNSVMTNCIVASATFTPETANVLGDASLQTVSVTPTFTPQTANAIATLTVESGTPVVSAPSITLQTGTPVVSAPTITLQTGTPAVSTPTITLEKGVPVATPTIQRIP